MGEAVRSEFAVHMLNGQGRYNATEIAVAFSELLNKLEIIYGKAPSRESALVKTKLEEACFLAKRAMAIKPEFQDF